MDLTFYSHIKEILEIARKKTYNAINFAMVEAYWEIGKSIIKMQGGNLTSEQGKGFPVTNLRYIRQFYLSFEIRHALCDELI